MFKTSTALFYLLLIGMSSIFIACNEENETPEPDELQSVEGSMVAESEENWTHFRFSKDFYSSTDGSSFEKSINVLSGIVYQQQPLFLTSHFFVRGGVEETPIVKLTVPTEEEMISLSTPYRLHNRLLESRQSVPDNLKDILDLGFTGTEKFIFTGEETYAWFYGQRKVFNAWRPVPYNAVRNSVGGNFGWINAASRSKLPADLFIGRPGIHAIRFSQLGSLDLAEIEGTETMVYPAVFTSYPTESAEPETKLAIVGKKLNFISDSLDIISILPDNNF